MLLIGATQGYRHGRSRGHSPTEYQIGTSRFALLAESMADCIVAWYVPTTTALYQKQELQLHPLLWGQTAHNYVSSTNPNVIVYFIVVRTTIRVRPAKALLERLIG